MTELSDTHAHIRPRHLRTSATGRERVPALDGLRAVGLLLIMGFHFGVARHARRLRRGGHLLRPVRLPHHRPAARRVGPGRPHQARRLLAAPGPPAAAGPAGGAGGGHPGGALRLSRPGSTRTCAWPTCRRCSTSPTGGRSPPAATTSWPPGRSRPSPTPGRWPSRSSSTWCGPWWWWPCSTWAGGSTGASSCCWGCPWSAWWPRPPRWPCSTTPGPTSPGSTSAPTPTPSRSWWGRCWPVCSPSSSAAGAQTAWPPRPTRRPARVALTVVGLAGFAGTLALTYALTGTAALAYRGGFLLSALSAAAIILGRGVRGRRPHRPGAVAPAHGVDRHRLLRRLPVALPGLHRARRRAHRTDRPGPAGPPLRRHLRPGRRSATTWSSGR